MKTHETCFNQLQDYLDGLLNPTDKLEIESHIESCKTCQDELAILKEFYLELNQLPELQPPVSLTDGVMSRIQMVEKPAINWVDVLKRWLPGLVTAYLAGLAIAIISGWWVWSYIRTIPMPEIQWQNWFTRGLVVTVSGLSQIIQFIDGIWIVGVDLMKSYLFWLPELVLIELVLMVSLFGYWLMYRHKGIGFLASY